jgi:hypothetical protein
MVTSIHGEGGRRHSARCIPPGLEPGWLDIVSFEVSGLRSGEAASPTHGRKVLLLPGAEEKR